MYCAGILCPGIQRWFSSVVASSPTSFCYASTLSLFVWDYGTDGSASGAPSCRLTRIIAGNTKTISAVSWSPHDENLLACASIDKTVVVWKLSDETRVCRFTLPTESVPTMLDWSPHDANVLAVGATSGYVWLLDQKALRANLVLSARQEITALQWSRQGEARLAVGVADASITIISSVAARAKTLRIAYPPGGAGDARTKTEAPVAALKWDPAAANYLLAAYGNGLVALFDVDRPARDAVVSLFAPVTGGLSSLEWLPGVPGGFVTTDSRSGVLRVWNVSQRSAEAVLKLRDAGFVGVSAVSGLRGQRVLVLSGADGSVGLYSVSAGRFLWLGEPNHTETIFSLSARADDPRSLTSGSFDGTVRTWDMSSLSHRHTMPDPQNAIVYCTQHSPHRHAVIAAGTDKGAVRLFDGSTGAALGTAGVHAGRVYALAWHPHIPELLASCAGDGAVIVWRLPSHIASGTQLGTANRVAEAATGSDAASELVGLPSVRFEFGQEAFGVAWDPHAPAGSSRFAVTLRDGTVKLLTVDASKLPVRATELPSAPVGAVTLTGHSQRAFSVAWHPHVRNVLATSSDDATIRVWHCERETCLKVLQGHTSHVRPVMWHPEVSRLLYSGSWDGTVRVWDVSAVTPGSECIFTAYDHHADVYALVSHPRCPFSLVSSSRDMAIRVWDARGVSEACQRLTARIMLAAGNPAFLRNALPPIDAPLPDELPSAADPVLLRGLGSRQLLAALEGQTADAAERVRLVSAFLYPPCVGAGEVVSAATGHTATSATDTGPASSRVTAVRASVAADALANAGHGPAAATTVAQHASVLGGRPLLSSSDRAQAAAELFLRVGEPRRACECLVELGEWQRALIIAPMAGLSFWGALVGRYASHLRAEGSPAATDMFIAAGQASTAVDMLLAPPHEDLSSAALVAAAVAQGRLPDVRPVDSSSVNAPPAGISVAGPTEPEAHSNELFARVCRAQVHRAAAFGDPMRAAAALAASGDGNSAASLLVAALEPLFALAVSSAAGWAAPSAAIPAALALESVRLHTDAAKLLRASSAPPHALVAFHARAVANAGLNAAEAEALYAVTGIQPPSDADGSLLATLPAGDAPTPLAVARALLAGHAVAAAEAVLAVLRRVLLEAPDVCAEDVYAASVLSRVFLGADLGAVDKHTLCSLAACSAAVAGLAAVNAGQYESGDMLLYAAILTPSRLPAGSLARVATVLARLRLRTNLAGVNAAVTAGLRAGNIDAASKLALERCRDASAIGTPTALAAADALPALAPQQTMPAICIGQSLPAGSNRAKPIFSAISHQRLAGRVVRIPEARHGNGPTLHLSGHEASLWCSFCCFAPALDGRTFHPYAL
jgi:WD40 repeat protein